MAETEEKKNQIPAWVQNLAVNLGSGGVIGVLLYVLLTATIPQMQTTFAKELQAEREIFRQETKYIREANKLSVDRIIAELSMLRESNRQERQAFLTEFRKIVSSSGRKDGE